MIRGRLLLQLAALIQWRSTMAGLLIMVNMVGIITGRIRLSGLLAYTTRRGLVNLHLYCSKSHSCHHDVSCFKVNLGELGEPRRTDHLVPFPPRNRK